jgi:hypothetical protein
MFLTSTECRAIAEKKLEKPTATTGTTSASSQLPKAGFFSPFN